LTHFWQVVDDTAASAEEYLPASHSMHVALVALPTSVEYFPMEQLTQVSLGSPLASENFP